MRAGPTKPFRFEQWVTYLHYITKGLLRELSPGPLAPEARIMPLDQAADCWPMRHNIHMYIYKYVFSNISLRTCVHITIVYLYMINRTLMSIVSVQVCIVLAS